MAGLGSPAFKQQLQVSRLERAQRMAIKLTHFYILKDKTKAKRGDRPFLIDVPDRLDHLVVAGLV